MRTLLASGLLVLLSTTVLSQAGSIDSSFGTNGIAESLPENRYLRSLVVQADGKLTGAGYHSTGEDFSLLLARYSIHGSFDKTFSRDGQLLYGKPSGYVEYHTAVQGDGKILVARTIYSFDFNNPGKEGHNDVLIRRYTRHGTPDTTFGKGGIVQTDIGRYAGGSYYPTNDEVYSIIVESNGAIRVAASVRSSFDETEQPSLAVVHYRPDGTQNAVKKFDYRFANDPDLSARLTSYKNGGYVLTAVKADSSVFLYSTRFGERTVVHPSGDQKYGSVSQTHHILHNGKIAVASYGRGDEEASHYLAVLNANGSADAGFSGNGYLELAVGATSLTSSSDNKIIAGGRGITRYNANGTLDGSFGTNGVVATTFGYAIAAYGNRLYELYEIAPNVTGIRAYLLSGASRYLKVNLYGNADPYSNREWNNWNNLKDRHFNNFYYSDSTASAISAVMSNRNGVTDNGADYGSGMGPAGVLRHSSYAIGPRTITFSGLSSHKQYTIELYGSRNAYSDDSTAYTINGVSKTIATYRNFTNKAIFTDLKPDAQGELVLAVSSTKTYNYLNGFMITENPASAANTVRATNSHTPVAKRSEPVKDGLLEVIVFPNPASGQFTLQLKHSNGAPVWLRVVNAAGKIIESRQRASGTLLIGGAYPPGIYYMELIQASQRKLTKLVKQSN